MATQSASHEVCFGGYTLDLRAGELRRNGTVRKLQPQPAKVLAILVSRAGEVVTRPELVEQVWGPETYVDFEHGLNYAIRQIRSVLDDDPEHPQFIETIPKRGYRFIAPLNDHSAASEQALARPEPVQRGSAVAAAKRSAAAYLITGALVVVFVVAAAWTHLHGRPSGRARIQSVAVLPLRNLSSDPEQEYFSDGITDELITELAKAGGLRVISHTSVERYKSARPPLPEIARQLGVDAIVEGTVMRSADRVRITAQLIDAHSDRHLWADSYERATGDIFVLQDELARRIAGAIGTKLIVGQVRSASRPTSDPAAHEAYLRGNFYWNQLSCDGFHKARLYFEQAINRDPQYSLAYAGLAGTYFTLADWGCSSDPELIAKSKEAALKTLELDPGSGEAHAWLGKLAFFYEWDFHKAANELAQAVELSPNLPEAHIIYAVFLVTTGRRELGLAEMRKAHDIDPVSQLTNMIGVVVFYLARQYDAAIEQGEKTLELYPGSWATYVWLAYAYEKRGLYDQAIASYLKAKELEGVSTEGISVFRTTYQKAGMRGFWQEELQHANKNLMTNACQFTKIYAHLGDEKQTLDFLNQSSRQHCSGPHTTIADPVLDAFRQNPRFNEIANRLGF